MNYSNDMTKSSYQKVIAANQVLRNTFLLLSTTLIFSAGIAYYALISNARPLNWLVSIIVMYGLFFLTISLKKSKSALFAIFLFTGFMGYMLGPILNLYIHGFSNGPQLVATAAGATGVLVVGLAGYAIVSRKDFNYMIGFITIASFAVLIGLFASFFFQIPLLQVLMSIGIAVISASYILIITSQLVNGGETNYIRATITLYVSIFNLFISLLRILSFFSGQRN